MQRKNCCVNLWGLTPREMQVIELYIELGTAKHVARHLGISDKTVESHLENTYKKMNVRTTLQAALTFDRENNAARIPIRGRERNSKRENAWDVSKPVNSIFALGAAQ